jgi:hypothetical protein
MKYKLIDLDKCKNKFIAGGACGDYFRLNARVGVKVLKLYVDYYRYDTYTYSKKWAYENLFLTSEEARNLKKAEKTKLTPKFLGYAIVKKDGKYRPAILMSHLESYMTLENFLQFNEYVAHKWNEIPFKRHVKFSKKLNMDHVKSSGDFYDHVSELLKKRAKIRHKDLHYQNVMLKLSGNEVTSIRIVDWSHIGKAVDNEM